MSQRWMTSKLGFVSDVWILLWMKKHHNTRHSTVNSWKSLISYSLSRLLQSTLSRLSLRWVAEILPSTSENKKPASVSCRQWPQSDGNSVAPFLYCYFESCFTCVVWKFYFKFVCCKSIGGSAIIIIPKILPSLLNFKSESKST